MRTRAAIPAALVSLALGAPAAAQDPLSAIDWLDRQQPQDYGLVPDAATLAPPLDEEPVTRNASRPDVTVRQLDEPNPDATGLLPPRITGFPQTLWQASEAERLADLITAQNVDDQPAMQSLLFALLLAEALPPNGSRGRFLLARIDRLISLGAVAQAAELMALTDPTRDPELFARVLDLSLLSGPGDAACKVLVTRPKLAPDLSARVYCLAQSGRWDTAVTTLQTGHALGDIDKARYNLLLAFLDPELAENLPSLPPSLRMTPLEYRLHEAVGEPVPTHTLPRAYANADLPGDSGWKAQIEAAERLVRAGALSEQRLFAIYALGRPSASGGVWDRVDAVQDFEAALASGKPDKIARTLRRAWPALSEAGLAIAFAKAYAADLAEVPLTGSAAGMALHVALLSPDYEKLAPQMDPAGLTQKFAVALARGRPDEATAPSSRARAIATGFSSDPPDTLQALLAAGKLGEVILRAMSLAYHGHVGDEAALTEALATFRAVGLEDTARRTAIQALLLSTDS